VILIGEDDEGCGGWVAADQGEFHERRLDGLLFGDLAGRLGRCERDALLGQFRNKVCGQRGDRGVTLASGRAGQQRKSHE
jgi:hypothetical protein